MADKVTIKKAYANVELSDGSTHHVRIMNRARIASEFEGNKRGWKPAEEYTLVRMTYAIWVQMTEDGTYTQDWKSFRELDCVDFDLLEDEPDEDPTESATEVTSVSPSPPTPESILSGSTEPPTPS